MIRVSVVIPTYNRSMIVVNAISSVIAQTYKNIEILVVDDGSTDDTAERLSCFGSRIRYIKKENGGVSSARNQGIKMASGELIAFLDSDDEWLPEKTEKQVKYLNKRPDFGMVICDCLFFDQNGHYIRKSNRRLVLPKDGYVSHDVLMYPSLIPSTAIIRKNVLMDVGLFDETLITAEDLDLHLKISAKYKIGLIEDHLVKCILAGGLSDLNTSYDDHVKVVENYLSNENINIDSKIRKKAIYKACLEAADGKNWSGNWRKGLFYTIKAMNHIYSIKCIPEILYYFIKSIRFIISKSKMNEFIAFS